MLRIVLSLILIIFTTTSWAATVVENVRLSNTENSSRVVIDLTDKALYRTFTLDKPHRLVIDLRQTIWSKKVTLPNISASLIKKIRHAQRDDTLRLVFDLNKKIKYETHNLKPDANHSHRIVIDLRDPKQPIKPIAPVTADKAPTPTVKPKTKPTEAEPAVSIKNNAPTYIKPKPKRDIVIAIDAGHGGKDHGATGKNWH
ncbi:MAG: AMIN domain-containing protein [Gammaproteobacteria bacterium]|nr:AMIN domain-containing protein [Gammaproteobacteria bacterium]